MLLLKTIAFAACILCSAYGQTCKSTGEKCKGDDDCCNGWCDFKHTTRYKTCFNNKSALQDTGIKLRGRFVVDDAHDVLGSVVVDKVVEGLNQ